VQQIRTQINASLAYMYVSVHYGVHYVCAECDHVPSALSVAYNVYHISYRYAEFLQAIRFLMIVLREKAFEFLIYIARN